MSEDRITIEKADNGWTVNVWKPAKEGDDNEVMYQEPEKLVATKKEEVMEIVEKNL